MRAHAQTSRGSASLGRLLLTATCIAGAVWGSHVGALRMAYEGFGFGSSTARQALCKETAFRSCVAPSVPHRPSQVSYARLAQHPKSAPLDPALLAEFAAAPWLLPARNPSLPYVNIHDLTALMHLRAQWVGPVGMPAEEMRMGVTLLLFSRDQAVMAQNSIYSLVKHGGAQNYIVMTWTDHDLEACADLNLPCADVRGLLAAPVSSEKTRRDFATVMFLKPAAILHALELGYAVMMADTDIAYSVKPVWASYLTYMQQVRADVAWMNATNVGHLVVLPTASAIAFVQTWSDSAPGMVAGSVTEQLALFTPALKKTFVRCASPCQCLSTHHQLVAEGRRSRVALVRTYLPSHTAYSPNYCTMGFPPWVPRLDPCDWNVLFVHTICVRNPKLKVPALQAAGFWFIDTLGNGCEEKLDAASKVPACKPLRWRLPSAEAAHFGCPAYDLGLVHGGEPAALQELRSKPNISQGRAEELFDVAAEGRHC